MGHEQTVAIALSRHLHGEDRVAICGDCARSVGVGCGTADSPAVGVPLVGACAACHTESEGFRRLSLAVGRVIMCRGAGHYESVLHLYLYQLTLVIRIAFVITAGSHHISIDTLCSRCAADGVGTICRCDAQS